MRAGTRGVERRRDAEEGGHHAGEHVARPSDCHPRRSLPYDPRPVSVRDDHLFPFHQERVAEVRRERFDCRRLPAEVVHRGTAERGQLLSIRRQYQRRFGLDVRDRRQGVGVDDGPPVEGTEEFPDGVVRLVVVAEPRPDHHDVVVLSRGFDQLIDGLRGQVRPGERLYDEVLRIAPDRIADRVGDGDERQVGPGAECRLRAERGRAGVRSPADDEDPAGIGLAFPPAEVATDKSQVTRTGEPLCGRRNADVGDGDLGM
jgi:hypothetical protein